MAELRVALKPQPMASSTPTSPHPSDGDTIKLGGVRWRLRGVNAPETEQTFGDGWPAGLEATAAICKLIEGRAVTCDRGPALQWPVSGPLGWTTRIGPFGDPVCKVFKAVFAAGNLPTHCRSEWATRLA